MTITLADGAGHTFPARLSFPDRDLGVELLDHPGQFAARMLLKLGTEISERDFH